MRKAQMFIVTAIFLSSTLFFLQQALVTYASLDSTKPFRTKEVYLLKDITDSVNATIMAGGDTPADCARFQNNVEELLSLIKDDVSADGYVFTYETSVDCTKWTRPPGSGETPFRLSVRLSETYDATGMIDFYHRQ